MIFTWYRVGFVKVTSFTGFKDNILMLFLILIFKNLNLAENLTNLAETVKIVGPLWFLARQSANWSDG